MAEHHKLSVAPGDTIEIHDRRGRESLLFKRGPHEQWAFETPGGGCGFRLIYGDWDGREAREIEVSSVVIPAQFIREAVFNDA